MAVLFARKDIFGTPVSVTGPVKAIRTQRESLPGVNGVRIYRLGEDTRTWSVRGRLTALSLQKLISLLEFGQSYQNGKLYQFQDSSGLKYDNCMLNDFRASSPRTWSSAGYTIQIQATVEQVAQ